MQTFQLTPEQFEQRKRAVQQATGEVLPAGDAGNKGDITHEGVTVTYDYEPSTQKLAVDVTHKPMLMPRVAIERKISDWFSAAAVLLLLLLSPNLFGQARPHDGAPTVLDRCERHLRVKEQTTLWVMPVFSPAELEDKMTVCAIVHPDGRQWSASIASELLNGEAPSMFPTRRAAVEWVEHRPFNPVVFTSDKQ